LLLLVTSRTRLHLSGEEEFPVGPLPLADAVTLIAQRGRPWLAGVALDGGKGAVLAEICRRLDCLPLALELVAPWFKLFEREGLRSRLTFRLRILVDGPVDLPDRQRGLRPALAWSYELLGVSERWLLRRLSVFAGGADLAAVDALCAEAVPEGRL